MLKKLVIATVVAFVAILMVLPVQAGEVLLPCSDCEKIANTTVPVIPQGETDKSQPNLGDHTWGGDPDEHEYGSWLDVIMCMAYWSPECKVFLHQTIWCD